MSRRDSKKISVRWVKPSRPKTPRDYPTHVVRLMAPVGAYPRELICSDLGALVTSESLCFSVVPYDYHEEQEHSSEYYSEARWATFNEIRLYSSILLSRRSYDGYICFYPFMFPYHARIQGSLKDKRLLRLIRQRLIEKIGEVFETPIRSTRQHKIYDSSGRIPLPPLFGGPSYHITGKLKSKLQKQLIENIDISDPLLIRGLSTLLRSIMIGKHYHFIEEATNSIFISLDASHQLILRVLESKGLKNPSSKDAADFIGEVFREPALDKYFEEFYETRIKSFHPKSRFGIYAHAPLMVDDWIHLRDALAGIYAYLITGYIDPEILEYEHVRFKNFETARQFNKN